MKYPIEAATRPGRKERDERGAEPHTGLEEQHAPRRAARRTGPRWRRTSPRSRAPCSSCASRRAPDANDKADDRAEGDERSLGTEHCAERKRADCGERNSRGMRDRCRLHADPTEWLVPAVTREEGARQEDDARTRDRQAEDQIPGRAGGVEPLREGRARALLQLVNKDEEPRDQRAAGTPTRAPSATRRQRTPPREGRGRFGGAHARTVSPGRRSAPVWTV